MHYLAIDPGDRRTGLAVGDDQTHIATPIAIIEASNPADRLARLTQIIAEHEPDELVLGLPLNMDGSEGPAAKQARELARKLTDATGLAVHLMDERLTSFAADEQLKGTGYTYRYKKARRDALAAATILRDFLRSKAQGIE